MMVPMMTFMVKSMVPSVLLYLQCSVVPGYVYMMVPMMTFIYLFIVICDVVYVY